MYNTEAEIWFVRGPRFSNNLCGKCAQADDERPTGDSGRFKDLQTIISPSVQKHFIFRTVPCRARCHRRSA